MRKYFQFSIGHLIAITLFICLGLSFPEFALFSPFAIAFMLLAAAITFLVFLGAAVFEKSPKPLMREAGSTLVSMFFVIVGLLAYT